MDPFDALIEAVERYQKTKLDMSKREGWHEAKHRGGPCPGVEECGEEQVSNLAAARLLLRGAIRAVVSEVVDGRKRRR